MAKFVQVKRLRQWLLGLCGACVLTQALAQQSLATGAVK